MVTNTLRTVFERLREDVCTALEKDPAARTAPEVVTYPGLHAVWLHRVEHRLWERGNRLLARATSHVTRALTGVEIHPAADLGRRVFIDHGMGTVVGETADIGDDVHMYHGVTLGGDDPRPVKRHPTVEDGVTLGANSTLVGPITVGEGATVGAGAVVVDDVPPYTTVAGNPAEVVEDEPEQPVADSDATDPATTDGPAATATTDETGVEPAGGETTGDRRGWLSC